MKEKIMQLVEEILGKLENADNVTKNKLEVLKSLKILNYII